jgi:hypothetical protein
MFDATARPLPPETFPKWPALAKITVGLEVFAYSGAWSRTRGTQGKVAGVA